MNRRMSTLAACRKNRLEERPTEQKTGYKNDKITADKIGLHDEAGLTDKLQLQVVKTEWEVAWILKQDFTFVSLTGDWRVISRAGRTPKLDRVL